MNSSHTAGPWKVIETDRLPHDGDHVADMSNGLMVVPASHAIGKLGDPLADARLIAAAPDLLEACIELLQHASVTEHMSAFSVERARAAVNKATWGRP